MRTHRFRNKLDALAGRSARTSRADDGDPRYWLVYDGQCALCRGLVQWVRRLDWRGRVLPLDLYTQQEWIARRAPDLTREQLLTAMHLIAPDRRVWQGFQSLRVLTRVLPGLWPAAAFLHLPGAGAIGPRWYHWVAANRHRLHACGPAGCPTHAPGQPTSEP